MYRAWALTTLPIMIYFYQLIDLSFDVQAARKLLIRLLSDALLGDQLGAEFVLLHLLSAV